MMGPMATTKKSTKAKTKTAAVKATKPTTKKTIVKKPIVAKLPAVPKMTKRNLAVVFFLTLLTGGLYAIYWVFKTTREMNNVGAEIPTAFCMFVPILNIWWLWKYSEGVAYVTDQKLSEA